MNIISLFQSFLNYFAESLDSNLLLHQLEHNILHATNDLNINTLRWILESIDINYKHSKSRKDLWYVQETRERTLITSLGLVVFNKTYYRSKCKVNNKYQYYSYLEDYLGIDKWAKMTLAAEVSLINNAVDNGMSWSASNTIPNYITSRQTISTKIRNINYNYTEDVKKASITPKTLYIEADEVHANLQASQKNKQVPKHNQIVPVILTHEGHKEHFVTKKELYNKHYIASSLLKTNILWNETYKYLDKRYNLDKVKYLFISGDGASWIKQFGECFPNAIYVLDKFHYKKALNYIFKRHPLLTTIADRYLRDRKIKDFKELVKMQIALRPHQKDRIIKQQNYLIRNIDGIINQRHHMYKCPCSMEGHISNSYAKFITSRPHAYSTDGLENITQLLTMKANIINLTPELYHQFKYGNSTYKELNLEKFISKFRLQANAVANEFNKYNTTYLIDNSEFSLQDNYRLDYFLNKRN